MAAFTVDRKVAVGAAVGGLVSILVWALDVTTGVKVPAEVAIAANAVITFAVQWMTKNRRHNGSA